MSRSGVKKSVAPRREAPKASARIRCRMACTSGQSAPSARERHLTCSRPRVFISWSSSRLAWLPKTEGGVRYDGKAAAASAFVSSSCLEALTVKLLSMASSWSSDASAESIPLVLTPICHSCSGSSFGSSRSDSQLGLDSPSDCASVQDGVCEVAGKASTSLASGGVGRRVVSMLLLAEPGIDAEFATCVPEAAAGARPWAGTARRSPKEQNSPWRKSLLSSHCGGTTP